MNVTSFSRSTAVTCAQPITGRRDTRFAHKSSQKIVAEVGTDMRRWPSAQHFTSWLTLAPKNKVSGGRLLSSRTQPSANRAAAILRLAATSLGRTQTALGAFYR